MKSSLLLPHKHAFVLALHAMPPYAGLTLLGFE
jgi:hypothetical protein